MIELSNIWVRHGAQDVVCDLTLTIDGGTRTALLGASGSGKTTTLRAIAGFEPVHRGEIQLRQQVVASPHLNVAPEFRHVGYVFQEPSLFPHLDVRANIAFGLKDQARSAKREMVNDLCERLDLHRLLDRYPHQLSGGQQQRVALARTLAPKPDIVLLDEPFSGLDRALRSRLCQHVAGLCQDMAITAALVTHDIDEALSFADQIAVIDHGRLLQAASPRTLLSAPASSTVASMLGDGVRVQGRVIDQHGHPTLACALGTLPLPARLSAAIGQAVEVWLRPQDLREVEADGMAATVLSHRPMRHGHEHLMKAGDVEFFLHLDTPRQTGDHLRLAAGESLLYWPGGPDATSDNTETVRPSASSKTISTGLSGSN